MKNLIDTNSFTNLEISKGENMEVNRSICPDFVHLVFVLCVLSPKVTKLNLWLDDLPSPLSCV